MPFFAVPILAQTLTFGVGDRAELRLVQDPQQTDLQADERVFADADLTFKHAALNLSYVPALLVTGLNTSKPDPTFLHTLSGVAQVFWDTRRTHYLLTQTASYGLRNFRAELLTQPTAPAQNTGAEPANPAMSPTTPTQGTGGTTSNTPTTPNVRVTSNTSTFWSSRSSASVAHFLSHNDRFYSEAGYDISGGVSPDARADYPLIYGPEATLQLDDRLTRRDALTSSLVGTLFFMTPGYRSAIVTETERLTHVFGHNTTGSLGVGPALTSERVPSGESVAVLHAAGDAFLSNTSRIARGNLTLSAGTEFGPVLDRVSLTFDSRVSVTGTVSWTREKTTLAANTVDTFSVYPERHNALNSFNMNATVMRELGLGFSVDGGTRLVWQKYYNQETIPPTLVWFAAVTWIADTRR